MDASSWSTQQLAEFVAVMSTARSEREAAQVAVERSAEALDADVAAIVCRGELVAAVGYPEDAVPVGELEAAGSSTTGTLDVPGVGRCVAASALLEHPPGATLVVARLGDLTREETGLLRGMARVAAITLRMLRVLDDERAARQELERLAQEQAVLRHIATLVARGAPPQEVFAAVTAEVGRLVRADFTELTHFLPSEAVTLAAWSATGQPVAAGNRTPLADRKLAALIHRTREPQRYEYGADSPPVTPPPALRIRSAVGVPIFVQGHLWGVIAAGSADDKPAPPGTEAHLTEFTELVATAIANTEARSELKASRARIVASADEARRRIERDLHDGAQQRLVSLVLRLRAAQASVPAELGELSADLDSIATELTTALDDLREMARGIHPTILAEGGLARALKTLARRSSVRVELAVRTPRRLPEAIEVTAYYVLSEALANAAKHADASVIHVSVEMVGQALRLSVSDDGVGGANPARGSGLVGLSDRVEANGGTIAVHSPPGKGTNLDITLPLEPEPPQQF